mgnify:CR=1 FL=1|jgi:hypothetical protein
MHSSSVKRITPKSTVGKLVLILGMLVILGLPTSSKFFTNRYVFSWSMYNGAWVHEYYLLNYDDSTESKKLSREDVLRNYKLKLLPYGLKPLEMICRSDKLLKSVERKGEYSIAYTCYSGNSRSK